MLRRLAENAPTDGERVYEIHPDDLEPDED
ncbi:hypothetical protein J2753_001275 [Halolamina salifodinae]|uniref:Uncharacterized protein n=1 Tax=Halolamina salifodinae TaxID=1202767 RepID=A0A8T4GUJ2_9EURY|nr:hypothetical protein [Halolamina salifodinae]